MKPSLVLGEAFVPGKDDHHFCKPTDVAVASNGIFFVSDGYCNNRILKFSADGNLIDTYEGDFSVAHSLTLAEDKDKLCVADREHSRIICIHAGLQDSTQFGKPIGVSHRFGRVYAITNKGILATDLFLSTTHLIVNFTKFDNHEKHTQEIRPPLQSLL